MKLQSDVCHWASDDKSTLVQVAWRHQAITWTNVDPVLCRHMVSLGHNELTLVQAMTGLQFLGTKPFPEIY